MRRAGRRFVKHAYRYGVLIGMQHCMPLRPAKRRLYAARGAPLRQALVEPVLRYGVLMGMQHCMPLRHPCAPARGGL